MCPRTPSKMLCAAEHGFKILPIPSRKVYPKALCANLDQPGKHTLELRAYPMDLQRACGCNWLVFTFGVLQPPVRGYPSPPEVEVQVLRSLLASHLNTQ